MNSKLIRPPTIEYKPLSGGYRNVGLLKPLFSVVLLILFAACGWAHMQDNAGHPTAAAPSTNAPAAVIPFELVRDHICVEVTIDRSRTLPMIIDSGMPFSSLDKQRADELKLVPQEIAPFEGLGTGPQQAGISKGHEVSLGAITLQNVALWITPTSKWNEFMGRPTDGVIGSDLFERYVVEIDYAAGKLRLYEPDLYAGAEEGYELPLTFLAPWRTPIVLTQIISPDGTLINAPLVLDTGAGPSLLSKSFTDDHPSLVSSLKMLSGPNGTGTNGSTKYTVGRTKGIRLGELTINEPVVLFSIDSIGLATRENYSGSLGNTILEQFTVVVDYKRRGITLKPNGEYDHRFEYDMSGMHLITGASDFHHFEVDYVDAASTAGQKGILVGDVIEAVNGRPARELTLDEIDRVLQRSGILRLKVGRVGKHHKIKLKLGPRI